MYGEDDGEDGPASEHHCGRPRKLSLWPRRTGNDDPGEHGHGDQNRPRPDEDQESAQPA